jgi:hypothetical protein
MKFIQVLNFWVVRTIIFWECQIIKLLINTFTETQINRTTHTTAPFFFTIGARANPSTTITWRNMCRCIGAMRHRAIHRAIHRAKDRVQIDVYICIYICIYIFIPCRQTDGTNAATRRPNGWYQRVRSCSGADLVFFPDSQEQV